MRQSARLIEQSANAHRTAAGSSSPNRTKSVLCSGIRHQGELLGVIYLEHTQITGTFSGGGGLQASCRPG